MERIGPRLDKTGKAQVGCAPTITYTNKQGKRTRDWNVGMPLDRFKWTWKMQQELLTLPAVQQLLLKQVAGAPVPRACENLHGGKIIPS